MASISNGELGSSARAKLNVLLGLSTSTQTGTTYTIDQEDEGTLILFTSSSNITVTVPTGLTSGFFCMIAQLGTGTVTVAASGTTINSFDGSLALAGRYAVGSLYLYGTNTFLLAGMLA